MTRSTAIGRRIASLAIARANVFDWPQGSTNQPFLNSRLARNVSSTNLGSIGEKFSLSNKRNRIVPANSYTAGGDLLGNPVLLYALNSDV